MTDGRSDDELGERRERVLAAMVRLVAENGFQETTVAAVCARAGLSTATFYKCFDGLDACLARVLDMGPELSGALMARAFAREVCWRDGVRSALVALLVFFDAHPALTRVWFGEANAAGRWALRHRERNIEAVQSLIVEHWRSAGSSEADPVLLRGVMGSVIDLIQSHVLNGEREPIIVLLAPLTRLITTPFLSESDVQHDVQLADERVRALLGAPYPPPQISPAAGTGRSLPAGRRAYQVLLHVSRDPGVSNRQIGSALGISHSGQISTLLGRLAREGLLKRISGRPGTAHAWWLTDAGEEMVQRSEQRESHT
jgi:AcrR family transcriptional regulator